MNLPDDFQFSASCLQDFSDCPRRFYLRYGLGLGWPAPLTVPAQEREQHLLAGTAFHRLVQQHQAGIALERLTGFAQSGRLAQWWENYVKASPVVSLPGRRYVEFALTTPFAGRRMVAKYDLLVAGEDGCLTIVDWKTSMRRPKREALLAQAQTRVYRYVLAQAGNTLLGQESIQPEAIRMIYWFAQFPDQPEELAYDSGRYQADSDSLRRLGEEIEGRGTLEDFEESAREESCKACNYCSYCERGGGPIGWEEVEEAGEEEDLRMDFDAIGEIAY